MKMAVFNKQSWEVETLERNGAPWFIATGVCHALGYANPSDATKYLDGDERTLIPNPSGKGGSKVTIINESGLYNLIFKSRMPDAQNFRKWVTSEVLPSIRQNGGYIMVSDDEDPELILSKAILLAQKTIERQQQKLHALTPKAAFVDKYMNANGQKTLTEVAKLLKIQRKKLIMQLMEDKFIFKRGDRLEPYAEKVRQKLFVTKAGESNGHAYIQLYVTAKGIQKLSERYAA